MRSSAANGKKAAATQQRVPPAPADLAAPLRQVWGELAAAVDSTGLYAGPGDLAAFRVLVRSVAMVNTPPAKMPATALVRLHQATAAMLASWGLTPASRTKMQRERLRLARFGRAF